MVGNRGPRGLRGASSRSRKSAWLEINGICCFFLGEVLFCDETESSSMPLLFPRLRLRVGACGMKSYGFCILSFGCGLRIGVENVAIDCVGGALSCEERFIFLVLAERESEW